MPRITFRRIRAVACVAALLLVNSAGFLAPADAFPGAPWFQPGRPYNQNFPDPAIILVDSTYYAYATTTGGSSMPVMTSSDLKTWIAHGDALVSGPSWSPREGAGWNIWAPTVVELPTGKFLSAFAARTGDGDRRCIAIATADSPLGPFRSVGNEPFVCELDANGAIDPFLIVDDANVPWLIWKNEGVPPGHPTLASRRTAFWSRPLTDTGTAWRTDSTVNFLMETTESVRPWQGTVVENPAMLAWGDSYLLTYSANQYDSIHYATGWARCEAPAGPCTESVTEPLLVSNAERNGPGGPAPFVDLEGILRLGYHGWNPPYTSYPSGQRYLFIDTLCVTGTDVSVLEPRDALFCDVPQGRYYSKAVNWLAANDITTGVRPSFYAPHAQVTRGQIATFLWRLMGEPEATSANPFVDVSDNRFYASPVRWLAGIGYVEEDSPTRFYPDRFATRAEMATFMWLLMGEPYAPAANPFGDVPDERSYASAVKWLAAVKVTTGVNPTTFDPNGSVTRAQMAAFLCRLTGTTEYAASGAPTPTC